MKRLRPELLVAIAPYLWLAAFVLVPFALFWVLWLQAEGASGFLRFGLATDLLLVVGGAVTAIPLLLFTAAARRLPYSTLGFLQYISPSLQFLLAVLAFGEPLTRAHLLCFGAIWAALLIFTVDGWRIARKSGSRFSANGDPTTQG